MRRRFGAILAFLVGSVILGACNTGTESGQLVLSRSDLTIDQYGNDSTSCENYAENKNISDGEKTGGVIVTAILGGIVGGVAAASAFEESERRLFEECMYSKGYQLIELPLKFHDLGLKEDQRYDIRKASVALLEEGKLDELQIWSRAFAINTRASYDVYLEKYPDGFFADRARQGPIAPK